jgi:hypothetical protein
MAVAPSEGCDEPTRRSWSSSSVRCGAVAAVTAPAAAIPSGSSCRRCGWTATSLVDVRVCVGGSCGATRVPVGEVGEVDESTPVADMEPPEPGSPVVVTVAVGDAEGRLLDLMSAAKRRSRHAPHAAGQCRWVRVLLNPSSLRSVVDPDASAHHLERKRIGRNVAHAWERKAHELEVKPVALRTRQATVDDLGPGDQADKCRII